jgi:acetolactate synthase-1/2/3 large subunit
MATDGFQQGLQAETLVHVDIDAKQIGKSYSPTHAVVASVSELLGALAKHIGDREVPRALDLPGVERHELPPSRMVGTIAPQDAIRELSAMLPKDTIYTVDSGEHTVMSIHYLEATLPDQFLVMTGLGSMGQSIGAAIGAQLAHPDRTVAAICGDGCFAMNAFEVATAVAERLPIRVFVFNDQRLGMVENGHKNVYGRSPSFPTNPLDICSIARGLGAVTLRIDGVGQLEQCEQALRGIVGPVVIDVRIDPAIVMPKKDRVGNMVQKQQVPLHKPATRPTQVAHLRVVN